MVGVERAPIEFDVNKGSGRFQAGKLFEGYRSLTGAPTTLNDSTVASVLGSPAYPGKVLRYQVTDEQQRMEFTPPVAPPRPSSTT